MAPCVTRSQVTLVLTIQDKQDLVLHEEWFNYPRHLNVEQWKQNASIILYFLADIDECHLGALCHAHADCQNNFGSYECVCHEGYTGDGLICFSKWAVSFVPVHFVKNLSAYNWNIPLGTPMTELYIGSQGVVWEKELNWDVGNNVLTIVLVHKGARWSAGTADDKVRHISLLLY